MRHYFVSIRRPGILGATLCALNILAPTPADARDCARRYYAFASSPAHLAKINAELRECRIDPPAHDYPPIDSLEIIARVSGADPVSAGAIDYRKEFRL